MPSDSPICAPRGYHEHFQVRAQVQVEMELLPLPTGRMMLVTVIGGSEAQLEDHSQEQFSAGSAETHQNGGVESRRLAMNLLPGELSLGTAQYCFQNQ